MKGSMNYLNFAAFIYKWQLLNMAFKTRNNTENKLDTCQNSGIALWSFQNGYLTYF